MRVRGLVTSNEDLLVAINSIRGKCHWKTKGTVEIFSE